MGSDLEQWKCVPFASWGRGVSVRAESGEWSETCWREVRPESRTHHEQAQSTTGIMEKLSNCGVGEDA